MKMALVTIGFVVVVVMLVLVIITAWRRREDRVMYTIPKHMPVKPQPSRDASRVRSLPGKQRIKMRRRRW